MPLARSLNAQHRKAISLVDDGPKGFVARMSGRCLASSPTSQTRHFVFADRLGVETLVSTYVGELRS